MAIQESNGLLIGIFRHSLTEDFIINIINKLRDGDIGNVCRFDSTIVQYGAFLYEKFGTTQCELIRQSMRLLGRLLIQLRLLD